MFVSSPFLCTASKQLLFISILWVILCLAINPYGEFPYNDDWAYAYSVKELVETGKFVMSPWTAVNLLLQIGWGALFCLLSGFSFTAIRISILVVGLFGLWGTHLLIRNTTDSLLLAFWGTLLMLVNPIYVGLSASFMSDVPFYTLAVWSLAYWAKGFRESSNQSILIGLGIAVLALLVRQFALALFVAFGVAYVVHNGITRKSIVVAGISVGVGLCVQIAYQRWLVYMVPDITSYNVQASNFFRRSYYRLDLLRGIINNSFVALMYTGLFMFPYFLWLIAQKGRAIFLKTPWSWGLATILVLIVWQLLFDGSRMPIWFNALNEYGLGPVLLRDVYYRQANMPVPGLLHFMLLAVTAASLVGGVVLLNYLIQLIRYLIRWSANRIQLTIVCLLFSFVIIYFLPIALQVIFDRYLLPFPVLMLLLIALIQPTEEQIYVGQHFPMMRYVSVSLLVVYGLFATFATHDFLAWNRMRWQALNNLIDEGIPISEIDGGLEFNGWHMYDKNYISIPTKSWWWVQHDTYVAGVGTMPGYVTYKQYDVATWLPWGVRQIVISKKNQSGSELQLANPYLTN